MKKARRLLTMALMTMALMGVMVVGASAATSITTEQGLIDALTDGGTYELGDSFTMTESITIPEGVTVSLDTKDFTVTYTGDDYAIYNEGTLAVTGVTTTNEVTETSGHVYTKTDGKYEFITTNADAPGFISSSGTFTASYVTFYSAVSNAYGGHMVYSNGGSMTLNYVNSMSMYASSTYGISAVRADVGTEYFEVTGGFYLHMSQQSSNTAYAFTANADESIISPEVVYGWRGALGVNYGNCTINGGDYSSYYYRSFYLSGDKGEVSVTINNGTFNRAERLAVGNECIYIANQTTTGDGGINASASCVINGGTFNDQIQVGAPLGCLSINGGTFAYATLTGSGYKTIFDYCNEDASITLDATSSNTSTVTTYVSIPARVTVNIAADQTLSFSNTLVVADTATITGAGTLTTTGTTYINDVTKIDVTTENIGTTATATLVYNTADLVTAINAPTTTIIAGGSFELTEAVEVPTGTTLYIDRSCALTLGDYTLSQSGGTISNQGTLIVKSDDAMESARTIGGNIKVDGSVSLAGDLDANRLYVLEGATLTVPAAYDLTGDVINEGTIVVNNNATLSVVGSDGGTVELGSSFNITSTVSLEDIIIDGKGKTLTSSTVDIFVTTSYDAVIIIKDVILENTSETTGIFNSKGYYLDITFDNVTADAKAYVMLMRDDGSYSNYYNYTTFTGCAMTANTILKVASATTSKYIFSNEFLLDNTTFTVKDTATETDGAIFLGYNAYKNIIDVTNGSKLETAVGSAGYLVYFDGDSEASVNAHTNTVTVDSTSTLQAAVDKVVHNNNYIDYGDSSTALYIETGAFVLEMDGVAAVVTKDETNKVTAVTSAIDTEAELREALSNASNGDVIVLGADVALTTSAIEISAGVTIDLAGNDLTLDGMTLTASASSYSYPLTITDSVGDGSLIIEDDATLSSSYGKYLKLDCDVINNGTITNNWYLYITDGATITNTGIGAITNNLAFVYESIQGEDEVTGAEAYNPEGDGYYYYQTLAGALGDVSTNGFVVMANNSTLTGNVSVDSTITLQIPAGVTLTIPTEYTLTNSGTIEVYGAIDGTVDGTGNIYYNITFTTSRGTPSFSTVLTDENGTLESLPTISYSGYTFNGWYYNGEKVTTDTVFTEAATVTASWTKKATTTEDTTEDTTTETTTDTTTDDNVTVETESTTTTNDDGSVTTEKVETATNTETGEVTSTTSTETTVENEDGSTTTEKAETTTNETTGETTVTTATTTTATTDDGAVVTETVATTTNETTGEVVSSTETVTTATTDDGATVTETVATTTNETTGAVTESTSTETVTETATVKEELKTTTSAEGTVTEEKSTVIADTETATEITATVATENGTTTAAEIVAVATEDTTDVTIPQTVLETVAAEESATITVQTAEIEIALDATATNTVADAVVAAEDTTVIISAEKVEADVVDEAHTSDLDNVLIVDLTITVGGETVSHLGGGTATVKIPYTKANSDAPLMVYYVNDAGEISAVSDFSYDAENGVVSFTTSHFSYYMVSENTAINFTDVAVGSWYYDAVKFAVENGITTGKSDTLFAPDDSCIRAEIVTFLYRAMGEPEVTGTCEFTDVAAGEYYTDAVIWAVENGITQGTGDGLFGTDETCTRGQIVTFLYRLAGEPEVAGDCEFTDVADGEYYTDAVIWAVENGITQGMGDGTFEPDADCTRVQIVTFLYRYLSE